MNYLFFIFLYLYILCIFDVDPGEVARGDGKKIDIFYFSLNFRPFFHLILYRLLF